VLPTRFELISMVPETIILSVELREQRRKYIKMPLPIWSILKNDNNKAKRQAYNDFIIPLFTNTAVPSVSNTLACGRNYPKCITYDQFLLKKARS
jgi:hypothetical protein